MKTMVIVGAGKGLGLSLAKRFGKEGFQIALVARNAEKLQSMVDILKDAGVEASYFVADIYSKEQMEKALADAKEKYGQIDIVEFSPTTNSPLASALDLTAENVRDLFEGLVVSAINLIKIVVPDMLARGEGALLFTSGLSAVYPMPMLANVGIPLAGLHNFVSNLHAELSPKGIFVAQRSLGLIISKPGTGTFNDPEMIADMWYRVYTERLDADDVYPEGITPSTLVW